MNNLSINYYSKYIKYKTKYINLFKLVGGNLPIILFPTGLTKKDKYSTQIPRDFEKLLCVYSGEPLTMVIGIDLLNNDDLERDFGINIDVGWSYEMNIVNNELVQANYELINDIPDEKIKWFQIYCNFNDAGFVGRIFGLAKYNSFIQKNDSNKINKIIFDLSTSNFIKDSRFIAYLYYYLLAIGGSIIMQYFIREYFIVSDIEGRRYPDLFVKQRLDGNHWITSSMSKWITVEKLSYNYSFDDIMENNRIYLEKILLGSTVTINSEHNTYPLTHPKYVCDKYYVITKNILPIINDTNIPTFSNVSLNIIQSSW